MHAIDSNEKNYSTLRERFDPVFTELCAKIKAYSPRYQESLLKKAYEFGIWAHRNQHRFSGEPYFEHCLNVAHILSNIQLDSKTIAAALLHDVVEDTGFTLKDIEEEFGNQISLLVDGVTKISEISGRKSLSYELRQAETFRKMLLSMAKDVRVIIIKFADRLHNMRTLDHVPAKSRLRISMETRDVYAPLAHRFGMAQIKSELEDLAFKYIDKKAYHELTNQLKQRQEGREAYIKKIIRPIKKELKIHNIKAEVQGRPKHLYSLYRKMKTRQKPLEEIYDLFAIRIIVDKVEECYYLLGIVHHLFTPVYERFKDYIAMPKFNNYQSLHTTVVDKLGHMVEIQIRTWEMHHVAEMGIAAHWRYKEGLTDERKENVEEQLGWIKQLLEQYSDSIEPDAHDFIESLKINLYQDEVFVFTPKGDVNRLPLGSTPIDFAFAVHTNIGMHCIGAKIDGKIVPLKYQLRSGDLVEIITSSNQHPHQDWLTFVKTSKARHHIRKYLREVQFEQSIRLGEEILSKYLKKFKIKEADEKISEVAKKFQYDSSENLKAAVGRGDISIEKILTALSDGRPKEEKKSFLNKVLKLSKHPSAVRVEDIDDMMVHIGRCCQPVPGDDILGYITRGKGVTIHRVNCPNMQSLVEKRDKTIRVSWAVEAEKEFNVQLAVLAEDRKNLLRDISMVISSTNTNIRHVDLKVKDKLAKCKLIIEVKNLSHLTRIIKGITKIKNVLNVERVESTTRRRRKKTI
jgi:guanosine-3',5'-bis(diphosphate) 3'-pyrophosphohydrolase